MQLESLSLSYKRSTTFTRMISSIETLSRRTFYSNQVKMTRSSSSTLASRESTRRAINPWGTPWGPRTTCPRSCSKASTISPAMFGRWVSSCIFCYAGIRRSTVLPIAIFLNQLKVATWDFLTWSDKSDRAKDFIKCLLRREPSRRLTAKEALNHPWITKNTHCERTIAKDEDLMARIQKLRCSIHGLKIWSAAA